MELVSLIYAAVGKFPKSEMFCLSQQMRKAAVSIPSNLAEGRGRFSVAEERQFARQARGSTYELQTQIEIAAQLMFVEAGEAEALVEKAAEVGRTINGYINSIGRTPRPGSPKA